MDDRELSARLQEIKDSILELREAVGLIPTNKVPRNKKVRHDELQ